MPDQVFTYSRLFEFTEQVFQKIGCSKQEASTATKTLLSADLRGIDSHGVARLSGYVRLWEAKRVNATPDIKVIHETPSTAVVDGDSGLGLVVAPFAMQIAIEKAKQVGTGWVSVQNSNHFGVAGDQHFFFTCYWLARTKTTDPVVHVFLERISCTKSIDAHCAKKMANTFSRLL